MANPETNEMDHIFTRELAASLAEAIRASSGGSWQLSAVDTPPARDFSDDISSEYCLTFSGNVSGSCFLVFDRVEAEVLVAGDPTAQGEGSAGQAEAPDPAAVLAGVLEDAVSRLSDRLAATTGAFTGSVAQAVAIEPSAVHRAQLLAVNDQGRSASVRVLFSPELTGSLGQSGADATMIAGNANLNLVMDVELNVTLRFGQRQLALREILDLTSGSVVELDRQVDEPVELILDGRVIARGEAVIIDGNYGVRVTEVYEPVVA